MGSYLNAVGLRQRFDVYIELKGTGLDNAKQESHVYASAMRKWRSERDRAGTQ